MKNKAVAFLTILFLSGVISLSAETEVPSVVLEVFQKKFPNIEPYKWEVNDKTAFVFFKKENKDKVCRMTLTGKFTDMGSLMDEEKLPANVKKAIVGKFPNLSGSLYYAIKNYSGKKGVLMVSNDSNNTHCILFSLDGRIVRKELFDMEKEENK